ncbi:MAG: DUF1559 domain-containing protein [Planctomycetaceae bacterium]|jgi:prepilin-type N-terminal cleavage/methylation domain-containing protein|nr:DUF1559 domain-containing protein [Planctomycetaceae bacterium]
MKTMSKSKAASLPERVGFCRRVAFTLIELLVVMVIIGLLAALLFPAINSAREGSRRITCTNNQHQIGIALTNNAANDRGLPGHVENVRGTALTWFAAILAELGEPAEFEKAYRSGQTPDSMPVAVCPSSLSEKRRTPHDLSYVANCGQASTTGNADTSDDNLDLVMFPDRSSSGAGKPNRRKLDEAAPGGASTTIAVSENVLAGGWYGGTTPTAIGNHGFLWYTITPTQEDTFRDGYFTPDSTVSPSSYIARARISSMHPNLVITLYLDGSAKELSTDIEWDAFLKLANPKEKGEHDHTP